MNIDINKKYTYRNGEPARVLCVDRNHPQPVVSLRENGHITEHHLNGAWTVGKTETNLDLVEIWEPIHGEWCYFYNEDVKALRLAKFQCMWNTKKAGELYYKDMQGNVFHNCARVVGELPEILKGK